MNKNTDVDTTTISGLSAASDSDIKIDPYLSASVKSIEAAINAVEELKQSESEKEKSEEGKELIRREKFAFDSAELEEALDWLAENFEVIKQMKAGSKPDAKTCAQFLNAISLVSDAIINVGYTNPGTLAKEDSLETVSAYFRTIEVREEFAKTFLSWRGIKVVNIPLFEDIDDEGFFKDIAVPHITMTVGEDTVLLSIVPSSLYMPDWYIFMNTLISKAREFVEDARIAEQSENLTQEERKLAESLMV